MIRTSNQIAYAFSAMMLFWFASVAILVRDPWIAALDLGFALSFLLVPWLNSRGRTRGARYLLITLINACFYVFPTLFGPQAGIHYCFLPAAALPFVLFGSRDRWALAYGVLLPVFLFTLLVSSRFTLFASYEQVNDPDWVFWLTLACAYVLSVLPAWASSRASERAEASLRESERKYSGIVELAQEGIWVIDARGVTTYANPAMGAMLGYDPSEMLGKSVLDFVSEADQGPALEGLVRRKVGRTERFEFPLRTREGRKVPTLVSASPLVGAHGQMQSAVALVLDLTDIKAKEKLLEEQRVKMLTTAKLSSLGEMAGGISHEINNPLTAISLKIGLLEHIARRDPKGHEEILKISSQMKAVIKRITTIIDGLKSFSRDDSSAPLQAVPLRTVIEDTLSFCRERFAVHGIALTVCEPGENLTLRCRPVQISQVLLNLLNNAFDAVLSEDLRRIEIQVIEHSDEVEIAVSDTGPGVPDVEADRIFEPFFTTKPVGQGTGLGLSVSKGIIEAHRGTLSYGAALKGRGARFAVRLPRA